MMTDPQGNKIKSSLLRILPEESPLRGPSPFSAQVSWPIDNSVEAPRALRGLASIVNNDLCHRCGSCVGICPTGVLETDGHGFPAIKHLSACTDCDLCTKVCPGEEFPYTAAYQDLFEVSPDITETHGSFQQAVIAYASNQHIRDNSSSGGLITAMLVSLIKNGQIDGALVVVDDPSCIWRGKPIIARSEEEILASMKSKYAIAPTNEVFSEILNVPGRYALVGLPCQIHGFIKAAKLDQRLNERVVLTIGLYCHAAVEHEAFEVIWKSLGSKVNDAKRFISRVGKHPGTPHLELNDGSLYPVYFPHKTGYRPSSMEILNIIYRIYTPARCFTCFDAMAEFADIAVGDPWMSPPEDDINFYEGWSFALLRTKRGQDLYREVVQSGSLVSRDVARREALRCNRIMAKEKRRRAFRLIETQRRQGKSIPCYDHPLQEFPAPRGLQLIHTELNILTHMLCFMPRYGKAVLRFFLGNNGYYLLWLNRQRRRIKLTLRDIFSRLRRVTKP